MNKNERKLFQSHKYPLTDFYYDPEKDTCFTKITKPNQFQYFGSNIQRFQTENKNKPGPGDYEIEKYYENNHKIPFFKSKELRFEKDLSKEKIPGPGHYDSLINYKRENKSFSNRPAIFGSGCKRFLNEINVKKNYK